MLIGLFKSVVLSTLAKSTMAFVSPPTVPVNIGLARDALAAKALIHAVFNGFNKSVVLSTFANPTPDFVKLVASAFKFNADIAAVDSGF